MTNATPPGPNISLLEILRSMASGQDFDPMAFARFIADTYGEIAYIRVGPVRYYQFAGPEPIHEILVEKAGLFHKARLIKKVFKPFAGEGLLTSEGDFWKRQRKLSQPAFHFKRIEGYAQTMVEQTLRMLDTWRDGEIRYLDREMMKLTLGIVARTLFSADVSSDADRVGVLMTDVLETANQQINAILQLPDWMPTPKRLREQRAIRQLDAIIHRFIDERRASGEDKGDLLSMLLLAADENGERMSDQQLRDEVMTLFLAGHETTAMALSWTWYLLAQHPDVMQKLGDEIDRVLGDRPPTIHDLPALAYTEMVVKESMRLYPPAPGVSREPLEDVTVGGYRIPKGALMAINTYAMHRSARCFDQPDTFIPERFSPERETLIPRYAYLPFGGGPRVCIGNTFALVEARLALAAMAQRFRLALVPDQRIVPQQLVTVRPKYGIQVRLIEREPARGSA